MHRFWFYVFILILFPFPLLALQGPTNNVISMPWDAFMQLWVSAREDDKIMPKPAYGRFLYLGEVEKTGSDYIIHVTSKVDVTTFSTDETLIPLFSEKLTLESLEVNGRQSTWTIKDGYYCVLMGGLSKHEIKGTFTLRPEINGGTKKIRVPFMGQARQEIVLFVPEKNIESYVDYGVALETIETDEGSQIHAYFKAMDVVTLMWYEKSNKLSPQPQVSSKIKTYLLVGDEGLQVQTKVHLDILEGWIRELDISIPKNFIVDDLQLSGKQISSWSLGQSAKEGTQNLKLNLNEVISGSQDLTINGLLPGLGEIEAQTWVAFDTVAKAADENTVIVGVKNSRLFAVSGLKNFTEASVNRDDWPQDFQGVVPSHTYQVSGVDPQIDFNIKNQTQFQVPPFEIISTEIISTLGNDGHVLHQANVKIKNDKAQYLPVTLPESYHLDMVSSEGQKISVIEDKPGHYLIPLPPQKEISEILITYQNQVGMKILGLFELKIPDFGFPVNNLVWHVGSNQESTFFVVNSLGHPLESNRPALNNQMSWKSFQGGAPNIQDKIKILYLSPAVSQKIVLIISLVLSFYVFWLLVFLFERAYLPDVLYETRTFVLGSALALLLCLSFLFFEAANLKPFLYTIIATAGLFALWQNRLVSKRFKILYQGRGRFLAEIILLVFVVSFLGLPYLQNPLWLFLPSLALIGIHFTFLKTYPKLVERRARMKVLPHLVLCLGLFFLTPTLKAAEVELQTSQELKEGHVYMEWNLIEDLLKKIEFKEKEKQKTAGLEYIFGSSKITGDISANFAQIRIETPVQILTDKWVRVPLMNDSQIVTEVSLDGEMLPLRREGNEIYYQGLKGKGAIGKLEIEVLLPVDAKQKHLELKTNSDLLKGANVELDLEENLEEVTLLHTIWQKRDNELIRGALDSTGIFEMNIRAKAVAGEESKPVIEGGPQLKVSQKTRVSIKKNLLQLSTDLSLVPENQELNEIHFALPENVEMRNIESDLVKIWIKEGIVDGWSQYKIEFKNPVSVETSLKINYQRALDFDEGIVEIPSLVINDVPRNGGYLVVNLETLAETKIDTMNGLQKIDLDQLPGDMKQIPSPVFAFKYPNAPFNLNIKRGKAMQDRGEKLLIEEASTHILVRQEPVWKGVLNFKVRNSGDKSVELFLPAGSKINKTLLDDQEVRPVLGDTGGIAIPLDPSKENQTIRLDYEFRVVTSLKKLGYIKLVLPRFAALVEKMSSSLELDSGCSLIPVGNHAIQNPPDYLRFLGVPFVNEKNVNPVFVYYENNLATGSEFSLSFLKMKAWVSWALLSFVFIILALFSAMLPHYFSKQTGFGFVLTTLLLVLVLIGPFPWFYFVASVVFGLMIHFLWKRLSNDKALVI